MICFRWSTILPMLVAGLSAARLFLSSPLCAQETDAETREGTKGDLCDFASSRETSPVILVASEGYPA